MKVVVVTPSSPHPFRNAAARWYYALVTELARRGHEVVCLSGGEEDDGTIRQTRDHLAGSAVTYRHHPYWCSLSPVARKLRSAIYPRSEIRCNRELSDDLEAELARGYDILHLEQLWTGWLAFNRPRSLLNIHHFEIIDVEHHHPGWKMWKIYSRIFERRQDS